MDMRRVFGWLVAPLVFLASCNGTVAIKRMPRDGVEVAGDFSNRDLPRVLAVRTDSPPGAPRYVSLTLKEIEAGADVSKLDFRLPVDRIELAGLRVHQVRVQARTPETQHIVYRHASYKFLHMFEYRATRQGVEPVDHRAYSHPQVNTFVFAALAAGVLALVAHYAWKLAFTKDRGPPIARLAQWMALVVGAGLACGLFATTPNL